MIPNGLGNKIFKDAKENHRYAESRLFSILSRTVPYIKKPKLSSGPTGNTMGRSLTHSPKRDIFLGSTAMPSFIGMQQRTSRSRLLMHILVYIATFAAWALTWTRRGTHTAGNHRQLPYTIEYFHSTTRQLVAYPWSREDTARQTETYRSVTGPVYLLAAALEHTWTRRQYTHTTGNPCLLPCYKIITFL